jgi:protein-tyrosine phosphatase
VQRSDRDRLVIRWDAAPELGPVRVYAGFAPDAIDRGEPLAVLGGTRLEIPDPDWRTRRYFALEAPDGRRFTVAERRIPLEKANNFRDLGGYRTRDGRRVRWGVLYRADSLHRLSDDDKIALSRLPLRRIIDFRDRQERSSRVSRLPEPEPELVTIPVASEQFSATAIEQRIRNREVADIDFWKLMEEGNREFVSDFEEEFSHFFTLLANPEATPTVFHCTAGKDRTGFAAAVVLLALGVPRETVIRDYLLTNLYTANAAERTLFLLRAYLFFQTPAEQLRPLFQAQRDFLEAALDEIDARWGSFDVYLREALGVPDERRDALRDLLLEGEPLSAEAARTPAP